MFEILNASKIRKPTSTFDIALDFTGPVGGQSIINTGTASVTFTAQGTAQITDQAKVYGDTSLLLSGAATNYVQSLDAVPDGYAGKDFYIGFYAKSRGNNTDPYRGFFHLGNRASSSANGILLINNGLYIANPAGTNWIVVAQATPSTAVFEHFGVAKRRTATNDLYRLFRNGSVVGTQTLAINQLVPGDDTAQLDIGVNRAAAQTVNTFMANFRMKIGEYVHWEDFNPMDDYAI